MGKQIRCGDIMPGCQAVVEGKDEAEVLQKAAAHAKDKHGVAQVTPDMAQKVKGAIRNT